MTIAPFLLGLAIFCSIMAERDSPGWWLGMVLAVASIVAAFIPGGL